jgi:hypothetical protein
MCAENLYILTGAPGTGKTAILVADLALEPIESTVARITMELTPVDVCASAGIDTASTATEATSTTIHLR